MHAYIQYKIKMISSSLNFILILHRWWQDQEKLQAARYSQTHMHPMHAALNKITL